MKRYSIKCREGRFDFFDIVSEDDDGFQIRLTRLSDGNERIIEEHMSRNLFDTCVQTGYILELETSAAFVA